MSRIVDLRPRGYAAIGLFQPKDRLNVGSVLRAAYCYQVALVATTGSRYRPANTDTPRGHKHIPLLQVDDLFDIIPYDCIPIAVDLVEGALPLPTYQHPERAFCKNSLVVPTQGCMNLAATVNVVLYDRLAKRFNKRSESDLPLAALAMGV